MSDQLSPASEQFISYALNSGDYTSREAVLDAAIAHLRADTVADDSEEERLRLVDEALADVERNGAVEMTPEDWASIRREGLEMVAALRRKVGE